MEVCSQNATFVEENGDYKFDYTKIIVREADQYYYAHTSRRYSTTSEIDITELDLVPIPMSEIWPPFPKQFTRAPEPLPEGCYIKRPSLLYYDNTKASSEELGSLLLSEARVYEILRAHPHPNIAQYLGCIVENDKITGLCLVKYGIDLDDRVTKDSRPFDRDLYLQGIRQGIRHLHSLDLIHCDINPSNILMDGDTPVIVDFDSCRDKGEKLGMKAGTENWTSWDFKFAMPENNENGLAKIRDVLFEVRKNKLSNEITSSNKNARR
jgi:serine/threonine protein kinase